MTNKRRTHEEIKTLILNEIKKVKDTNKTALLTKFKLHGDYLEDILILLQNEGQIMIARIETFKGNKKTVQAVIIKYTGNQR